MKIKFDGIYGTLSLVIILSAINSAVGYVLIMTFDFLPRFLMVPLLVPFTLGCSIMGFLIIIKFEDKKPCKEGDR